MIDITKSKGYTLTGYFIGSVSTLISHRGGLTDSIPLLTLSIAIDIAFIIWLLFYKIEE